MSDSQVLGADGEACIDPELVALRADCLGCDGKTDQRWQALPQCSRGRGQADPVDGAVRVCWVRNTSGNLRVCIMSGERVLIPARGRHVGMGCWLPLTVS